MKLPENFPVTQLGRNVDSVCTLFYYNKICDYVVKTKRLRGRQGSGGGDGVGV